MPKELTVLLEIERARRFVWEHPRATESTEAVIAYLADEVLRLKRSAQDADRDPGQGAPAVVKTS